MAFLMLNLVFTYVVCVAFMILASSAELNDMNDIRIVDYINYMNPPAVHKYKHDNGDTILCVRFADQISLRRGIQLYGHDKKTWKNTQAREISPTLSSSRYLKTCPEGTVSIKENKYKDVKATGPINSFRSRERRESLTILHKYAVVKFVYEGMYRAQAKFNIWQPQVAPYPDGIFSLAQIWVIGYLGNKRQRIEAGWIVYPFRYNDSNPRLFVFWTPDSSNPGCWDQECNPGFVLCPKSKYYPGQLLEPVSEYGGKQIEKMITIKRETLEDEPIWSIYIDNEIMGYWPASLFGSGSLNESAKEVHYGGEVTYDEKDEGTPFSKTEMGSGHFPIEGYSHTAYIRDIQMHDINDTLVEPEANLSIPKPNCYNLTYAINKTDSEWGQYIFFGGPGGYNPSCVN